MISRILLYYTLISVQPCEISRRFWILGKYRFVSWDLCDVIPLATCCDFSKDTNVTSAFVFILSWVSILVELKRCDWEVYSLEESRRQWLCVCVCLGKYLPRYELIRQRGRGEVGMRAADVWLKSAPITQPASSAPRSLHRCQQAGTV